MTMRLCRFTAVWARGLVALTLCGWMAGVAAQPLRDPTVPPASASSAPAAAGREPLSGGGPMAVIVREGRPFLVVGTRLYGQGQMLGGARIERILETEVWLREGKTVRKQAIFSGIERRPAIPVAAVPECPPPTAKPAGKRAAKTVSCPP